MEWRSNGQPATSAGSHPTLLDWSINRWSASTAVNLLEELEDPEIDLPIAYRINLPFERVDSVDIVKNPARSKSQRKLTPNAFEFADSPPSQNPADELACRFTLNGAPTFHNVPLPLSPAAREFNSQAGATISPSGRWVVVFTSDIGDGEPERVLRKTLEHRAKVRLVLSLLPPCLVTTAADPGSTAALPSPAARLARRTQGCAHSRIGSSSARVAIDRP